MKDRLTINKESNKERFIMEEKEVFYNGFCRCQNQGRIVLCVYVKNGENWKVDDIDCGYFSCPHGDSCEVAKAVEEGLQG